MQFPVEKEDLLALETSVGATKMNFSKKGLGFYETFLTVNFVDVESTCSYLCLSGDNSSSINAWTFNTTNRQCQCIRIKEKICKARIDMDAQEDTVLHVQMVNVTVLETCEGLYLSKYLSTIMARKLHFTLMPTVRLMLISGIGNTGPVATTTFIKTHEQEAECQPMDPLPVPLEGATGGLVYNEVPMICGGRDAGNNYRDECYFIGEPEPVVNKMN